jgi:hypothetical protein
MRVRLPLALMLGSIALGCPGVPEAPCQVGVSEITPYLVQLRPTGSLPGQCPQGQQYQALTSSEYRPLGSTEPLTVVFQPPLSTVDPPSAAQAMGRFDTPGAPSSGVCTIATLTPAIDDSATPVNALVPVGAVTYAFSSMEVLSDAVHQATQFGAKVVVDFGIPGCSGLNFVAQAAFPVTPCLNDQICLPDPVPSEPWAPVGRGLGSGLPPDNRAFCNLDPALLDNAEVMAVLQGYPYFFPVGREAYEDPNDGSLHDVGVCFFSEPFPSLCPAGSTLSTSGPCVVGPGSNPH